MKETFKIARLFMVLGSLTPFFLLLGIKGSKIIPSSVLWFICIGMIFIPNFILWVRILVAKKQKDKKIWTIESYTDNRDHLLVYLFTVLIPLYQSDLDSFNSLLSLLVVFFLIIFLFMHMNMHYINILFALFGFRIMKLKTKESNSQIILLTQKELLNTDEIIQTFRISNTVYIELKSGDQ